jgi:integrase
MAKRGSRQHKYSFRPILKSGSLYARYTIPEKDPETGKIVWQSKERSTGTPDVSQARKFVEALIDAAYEDLTKDVEKRDGITFNEAVISYIKSSNGWANKQYLPRIVEEIGDMPIVSIKQKCIDDLAEKLYPGRTAATLNRQIYTPVCAVLNAAASDDYTAPRIKRPKGHLPPSNFKRPSKDWWARVLPECPPNLVAFVLFCRLHGRRTGEACRITPSDIDAESWQVTVLDTKGKQEIRIKLSQPVINALDLYPWRLNKYVFGFSSRWSVYKPLRNACERAGVEYSRPKDSGRHSWASGLLDQGKTLKEVKEAGRWKTMEAVGIYSHLERSRVDDEARNIGENWAEKNLRSADVISPSFRANNGQSNSGNGK